MPGDANEFRIKAGTGTSDAAAGADPIASHPKEQAPSRAPESLPRQAGETGGVERGHLHSVVAGLSDLVQRNAEINLEAAQATRQAIAQVHQRLDQLTQIARSLRNGNGGGG